MTDFEPINFEALPIAALAPIHAALDPDLPPKMRELAEVLFIGIGNSKAAEACAPETLAHAALAAMWQLSHEFGGNNCYFPRGDQVRALKLKRAVRAGFTGDNHSQLARKHGISEMRVRQILSQKEPS